MSIRKRQLLRGKVVNGEKSAAAIIILDYEDDVVAPIHCIAIVAEEAKYDELVQENAEGLPFVDITAPNYYQGEIWGLEVQLGTTDQGKSLQSYNTLVFQGAVRLYIETLFPVSFPSTNKYLCYLTLPYSPLFDLDSDYEFKKTYPRVARDEIEATGIWWNTPYGKAELVRTVSYSRSSEPRGIVKNEILECQIFLQSDLTSFGSLKEAVLGIQREMEDVIWLLSLLCGKKIDWFKGTWFENDVEGALPIVDIWHQAYFGFSKSKPIVGHHENELFVDHASLRNGGFAKMFDSFRHSEFKDVIVRAIQIILATYEDFYFEAQLGLTYIAFETLINGVANEFDKTLEENEFEVFKASLIKVLKDSSLKKNQVDEIKGKVGEFKRRGFKTKALLLLQKYEISIENLFPPNQQVKTEFAKIVDGRNKYTHAGQVHNFDDAIQDFHRLRYLCKALIIRLLGHSLESINERDEDLHLSVKEIMRK